MTIGGLIFLAILIIVYPISTTNFIEILFVENIADSNNLINIENFAYSPYQLIINVGEKVQGIKLDTSKHTVNSIGEGPLNSVIIRKRGNIFLYI